MKLIAYNKNIYGIMENFLLLLFFSLPLINYAFGVNYYIPFIIIFFIIILCYNIFLRKRKIYFIIFVYLSLFSLMIIMTTLKFQGAGIFYSFISIPLLIISYYISNIERKKIKKLSFLTLIIYYFFFIFSGIFKGFSPESINFYLIGASRNIVSSIAIFLQLFYSIAYFHVNRKLPILTVIVTTVICILSFGRTGIALSLFLLFTSYIINNLISVTNSKDANKYVIKSIIIYAIITIITSLIIYKLDDILNLLTFYTNFGLGLESPRDSLRQQYMDNLDLEKILFGVNLSTIPDIHAFNNNPHNSYIYGHSQFGLLYIIYIITTLLLTLSVFFNLLIRSKKINAIVFITFTSIFTFRAFYDKLAFIDVSDFIYYYIVFSFNKLNQNSKL